MRVLATIRLAIRALRRNKLRSILTMLGVIIGVGSVIAAVSITTGATKALEQRVANLGQNIITVFSGNFTSGAMRGGWGSAPTLTVEDADAIGLVTNVVAVSPEVRDRDQVQGNGQNWNTLILGESPDYPQIRNWNVADGSMYTDQDVRSVAKVAVIGQTIVDQLYPGEDPIGQTIRLGNIPFKIVGVLEPKGFNLFGQDQDDVVVIPYSSHMKRIERRRFVNSIQVAAATPKSIAQVQQDINSLLAARHRSPEPDFTVRTQVEIAQFATESSKTMSNLLAAIAGISLIVGGIGIMNIMLVSVTERTREIGIRMAVGARERDILIQFLVEAVTLSAIGGLIGIIGGITTAEIITSIRNLPIAVPVGWVVAAVFSSGLIGIVSGFYPAWKASQLDPIEALRYE